MGEKPHSGILYQQYLNKENELVRHIVLGVLANVAKSEADWTSEQVRRGLKAAKAKGKRLGAPSKLLEHKHAIISLKKKGLSNYAIAKRLKLSPSTVGKYVDLLEGDVGAPSRAAEQQQEVEGVVHKRSAILTSIVVRCNREAFTVCDDKTWNPKAYAS